METLKQTEVLLTKEIFEKYYVKKYNNDLHYLGIQDIVDEIIKEAFPNFNLVKEGLDYEDDHIYNHQGDIKAYLGNIGRIYTDINILRKGLKIQGNYKSVNISVEPKWPVSYVFRHHDPFEDNFYYAWRDVKVRVERRHLESEDGNAWLGFLKGMEWALSEHLNEKGWAEKIREGIFIDEVNGLYIRDAKFGHLIEVLPPTNLFRKDLKKDYRTLKDIAYEGVTFICRVPERFIGEFEEIENFVPSWKQKEPDIIKNSGMF